MKDSFHTLPTSMPPFNCWLRAMSISVALILAGLEPDVLSHPISQVLAISASASSAALKVRSIVASSCSTELNAASNWLQGR